MGRILAEGGPSGSTRNVRHNSTRSIAGACGALIPARMFRYRLKQFLLRARPWLGQEKERGNSHPQSRSTWMNLISRQRQVIDFVHGGVNRLPVHRPDLANKAYAFRPGCKDDPATCQCSDSARGSGPKDPLSSSTRIAVAKPCWPSPTRPGILRVQLPGSHAPHVPNENRLSDGRRPWCRPSGRRSWRVLPPSSWESTTL
jgi:hypothetical protein